VPQNHIVCGVFHHINIDSDISETEIVQYFDKNQTYAFVWVLFASKLNNFGAFGVDVVIEASAVSFVSGLSIVEWYLRCAVSCTNSGS
jgi:hypothetical protein